MLITDMLGKIFRYRKKGKEEKKEGISSDRKVGDTIQS